MKALKREELLHLIKYYEQCYFTYDLEIPFKANLNIYPIIVENYYKFYSCVDCIRMDKNSTMEGVSMSDLGYLLYCIDKDDDGKTIYSKLIQLLEMVFHIESGKICPECGHLISYSEINQKLLELTAIADEQTRDKFMKRYITEISFCQECKKQDKKVETEDSIRYINEKGNNKLIVNNVEFDKNDYNLLKNIILYYNIPDYDDEYIDPELKAELEEVARLKNPNQVQPSLEKQMSCIISATSSYTYESIKKISIRKLVLLLRTIDARLHYFAYRQGELSGMVKFSKEIDHWIYSSDKKNKFEDIMTLDALKDKLKDVT